MNDFAGSASLRPHHCRPPLLLLPAGELVAVAVAEEEEGNAKFKKEKKRRRVDAVMKAAEAAA